MACICSLTASEHRADYDVIPLPKEVTVDTTQTFSLASGMGISYDPGNEEICRNARFLRDWVQEMTGIELLLTPNDSKAAVKLTLGIPAKKGETAGELTPQQEEAYVMTVDKKGVHIQANKPVGIFRAGQTLRKSLPVVKDGAKSVELPFAVVKDEPRFEYRGVLLDCGRHFFTVETIKTFLDVMALHGSNQFHWHLTEDQGWRFEVKAYPSLAPIGSVRQETVIGPYNSGIYDGIPYGGYYTQDDCREVLCGGNPETLVFLKTVLGELCEVFPSKYIHIGGDECRKHRWFDCPKCQAKIKELGLVDKDGKQPRTTDSYIVSASKIYSFEPLIPEELTPEQQKLILGPQVNLWTEHVKYPAHAFYQLLPRLGASSEVQWCLPEQKDFENFKERLPHLKEIYEVIGVPYCKLLE